MDNNKRPQPRTHDTSLIDYHVKDVKALGEAVTAAAAAAFPNGGRSRYKEVHVLLLSWKDDNLGVIKELAELQTVFESVYRFQTETWEIPTLESHNSLVFRIMQFLNNFKADDNLLVVYYGGHGGMNDDRQCVWSCTESVDSPTVQWYGIQIMLEQTRSDVLILLDCCAAASSASSSTTGVTEVIAACGFEAWAPGVGEHSFTRSLIDELKYLSYGVPFTTTFLHNKVLSTIKYWRPRYELNHGERRRTPVYIRLAKETEQRSIVIEPIKLHTELTSRYPGSPNPPPSSQSSVPSVDPQEDVDMPSSESSQSLPSDVWPDPESRNPKVLVSIALEDDQWLRLDEMTEWLRSFPALANWVHFEGVFKSDSTLIILSLPVAIWNLMPKDPAVSFIGFVRSRNMIRSVENESSKSKAMGQEDLKKLVASLRDPKNVRSVRTQSAVILRKLLNESNWPKKSSILSVVDDFIGLTPLSGAADARIHVYFVHGLGGHAFRTWCSDADGDITKVNAWPRDLLPKAFLRENINAQIFTLGYNASPAKRTAPNATIQSTAEDLLTQLMEDRSISSQKLPNEIYFVCHSLGGLVVCEALIMALFHDEVYINKPQYRDLFMDGNECLVKGVCFMGTPLLGNGPANLLAPFVRAVKGPNKLSGANVKFLGSLRENNQSIDIPTIVRQFKSIAKEKKMRLLVGCEEISVAGSQLTVTYESALSIFKDIAIPFHIPADHRGMVKFDDSRRADYRQLEELIIKMIINRLTLQAPSARPLKEILYNAGDSTLSSQAQSPSSPNREQGKTSHQNSASPPAININRYYPYRTLQPSFGEQQSSEEQEYQAPHRLHTYPNPSFSARDIPSKQKTAPVSTSSAPLSDPNGPWFNTGGPSSKNTRFGTDYDVFNRLKMFDTVFIVDDTGSMGMPVREDDPGGPSRWEVAKHALENVAKIVARYDEDGIGIRFLKAEDYNEDAIRSSERVEEILENIDVADENHGGGTEFRIQLESLIRRHLHHYEDYIEKMAEFDENSKGGTGMHRHPKEPKSLNVIVITDGQADDEEELEEYILEVARKLDRMNAPKNYISIQFIQIGDDERASDFLLRLDDDIKTQRTKIRGIVGTTPYDGLNSESNVPFSKLVEQQLKLLLGGITQRYDKSAVYLD